MAVRMAATISKLAVLTPYAILESQLLSTARFIDVVDGNEIH